MYVYVLCNAYHGLTDRQADHQTEKNAAAPHVVVDIVADSIVVVAKGYWISAWIVVACLSAVVNDAGAVAIVVVDVTTVAFVVDAVYSAAGQIWLWADRWVSWAFIAKPCKQAMKGENEQNRGGVGVESNLPPGRGDSFNQY